MMKKEIGEKGGIVGNDAIGEQTTAFLPQILFIRGAKPELAKVSVSNRPSELMITFPAIQGTLNMVSQGERIELIEQVKTVDNAIIFFECSPCFVLSGVAMQLADDQMLRGGLQRQRDHQPFTLSHSRMM